MQAELSKRGIELPAKMAKQATATPAVTQAMRDAARQRAGRAVQTPDQAAREAARRAQQAQGYERAPAQALAPHP